MKKMLKTLLLINVVALVGFIGFLLATGRVDSQKAGAIVDLLKRPGSPPKLRETLFEILEPLPVSATAPSTQQATTSPDHDEPFIPLTSSAAESIAAARQSVELERLRLEREAQNLQNRQEVLETRYREIQLLLKTINDRKRDFEQQVAAVKNDSSGESLQRSLALYDELKPKQIKELFIGLPVPQVATFLQAMDSGRAGKIIAEFKSPEDRTFIARVLEHIRISGTSAASPSPVTNTTTPFAGS